MKNINFDGIEIIELDDGSKVEVNYANKLEYILFNTIVKDLVQELNAALKFKANSIELKFPQGILAADLNIEIIEHGVAVYDIYQNAINGRLLCDQNVKDSTTFDLFDLLTMKLEKSIIDAINIKNGIKTNCVLVQIGDESNAVINNYKNFVEGNEALKYYKVNGEETLYNSVEVAVKDCNGNQMIYTLKDQIVSQNNILCYNDILEAKVLLVQTKFGKLLKAFDSKLSFVLVDDDFKEEISSRHRLKEYLVNLATANVDELIEAELLTNEEGLITEETAALTYINSLELNELSFVYNYYELEAKF